MAAPETSSPPSVQASRSPHEPRVILVTIAGHIARSHASRLGQAVHALLEAGAADLIRCDVAGIARADGAVIDALCRMQLAARRHGCGVEICGASKELQELLYLTGLTNVLPAREESGFETEGQSE